MADLSQRDLATLLGVSQAAVAHWETGRRLPDVLQFEAVVRIAGLRVQIVVAEAAQAHPGPPQPPKTTAPPAPTPLPTPPLVGEDVVPVDARGGVLPMRPDGVRDGGGRRYPAHLDPEPLHQVWRPRWDRPELNLCCHRRRRRDAERARPGRRPLDHVTPGEVVATFADWRAERLANLRRSMPPRPTTEDPAPCTCPIDCEEGACPDGCPCGCERAPSRP